jgi:hypothetical protein
VPLTIRESDLNLAHATLATANRALAGPLARRPVAGERLGVAGFPLFPVQSPRLRP